MRRFSKHGALGKHDHEIEGINSRLDGIQAAILSVKLNYILDWTELRIQIAKHYHDKLSDQIDFELPLTHNLAKHVFHLYVIRLKLAEISLSHEKVFNEIRANGIGVNLHYIPVHLQPFYQSMGYKEGDFPESEKYYSEAISLPMYPNLSTDHQDKVVKVLASLVAKN